MNELETVKALYHAWGSEKHGLDDVRKLIDPDLAIRDDNDVPWAGRYNGLAGLEEYLQKLMTWLDCAPVPQEYVHAGDRVIAIGDTKGNMDGEDVGSFAARFVHIWEIKNGRITKYRPYLQMETVKPHVERVRLRRLAAAPREADAARKNV